MDDGLIRAAPNAAVEVAIGSGLVAGFQADTAAVALVEAGGLTMHIRSSNPGRDAWTAIDGFERALRAFISRKMSNVCGPRWIKQRVDGGIRKHAAERRRKALGSGETEPNLIQYVELGELRPVLTRADNWSEIFESVFVNRDRLLHDLGTLNAVRRPTMHARRIDAVRLAEILCVMSRLNAQMQDDGAWREVAASDE